MTNRLAGKVAIIIGGSQGLGLAIGEAFAGAGAWLLLAARNQESLDSAAATLGEHGAEVAVIAADVTDEDARRRIAAEAGTLLRPRERRWHHPSG